MAPEVNLRECVTYMPPPNVDKFAHSGFETQRRCHQKSKTRVSVPPQKGHICSPKSFRKKNKTVILERTNMNTTKIINECLRTIHKET